MAHDGGPRIQAGVRRRGTEWWGKSPFGYFWGSFPKVTRRKGGTHSSRYRRNGYVLNPIQSNPIQKMRGQPNSTTPRPQATPYTSPHTHHESTTPPQPTAAN